ncbi:hypothetical protein PL10110_570003 [Planktothrix agardhii]|nr:hypothetical protein PL10110_570003 [Planktothrix agardhii]
MDQSVLSLRDGQRAILGETDSIPLLIIKGLGHAKGVSILIISLKQT